MESLIQDFKFGVRTFLKSPGFTVVALLTIALGIGANTAIFSVVNGVLLKPLPLPEPERIVMISGAPTFEGPDKNFSAASIIQWAGPVRSFESIGVYGLLSDGINLTGGSEPDRVNATEASANFFAVMGAHPILGRNITSDDEQKGKSHVVILSHGLWTNHFGGDQEIVGKEVTINNTAFTVIGVMPSEMKYPAKADLWIPIALGDDRVLTGSALAFQIVARLKPGISAGQAQSELIPIVEDFQKKYPDPFSLPRDLTVTPMLENMVSNIRQSLFILLGAVGFVLLIACANVTNLLLARGAGRRREVAIRFALGAKRIRLVRQFLLESLMLSIVGGAAGLLVALWSIDALRSVGPASLPRLNQVKLDTRVFAFTLVVSLVTGVIFGLIPALQSSKVDLTVALKDGGAQSGAGRGFYRMRSLLVAGEMALALVLLIGAGLLMKSFVRLMDNNPGFNSHNLLTLSVDLPDSKYPKTEQKREFFKQFSERVRAIPGATNVSLVNSLPFAGFSIAYDFKPDQDAVPGAGKNSIFRVIGPDFFKTMGIGVLKGRAFNEQDNKAAAPVIIINDVMASRLWPDKDPLGRRIFIGQDKNGREVVGVVPHLKHHQLDEKPEMEMFAPVQQSETTVSTVIVQTSVPPMGLVNAIREEVRNLDKDLPIYDVKTMEQRVSESVAERRFTMLLLGTFAATSLILAMIGIYGVMSYSVTRQTHEIGIRMALGAQRNDVLKAILRQGMSMTLIGLIVGLATSFALTRFLTALLYGVTSTDPMTFIVISIGLVVVALSACLAPAIRATKIDPMVALRYD